ncbi:MAG: type VI secretion system-associated protein TagF [Paracoccaceae bacterium]
MGGGAYAFGKMPSVGDFFRLGAPRDFIAAWDPWLQSALLAGQQAMGAEWDNYYMSTPIWRFMLAPGLAGSSAVAGVLMPSVDRVGRRFPLTLLKPLEINDVISAHFGNDGFYEGMEDLALAALEDDMTRDRLEEELAKLPDLAIPSAVTGHRALSGADVASLHAGLAARAFAGRVNRPSLWTARLPDTARMIVCNGLPAGGDLMGLFNLDAQVWQEGAA